MYDDVLGNLRKARVILKDELAEGTAQNPREIALTVTKIDEALLWRQEVLRLREPTVNESSIEQMEEPS